MKLVGANPSPRTTGLDELPGKSNYFLGRDPTKWRTNVAKFARVSYGGIYPGIDLIYYGSPAKPGELEYDFVVAPGADPRAIKFAIQGATRVAIDASGDLVAELDGQEMRLHKPLVYQPEKRKSKLTHHNLEGNYVLTGDNQVAFRVPAYNPQKELVIDPVLKYSTYLGGSGDDWGSVFNNLRAIAVDPMGQCLCYRNHGLDRLPDDGGCLPNRVCRRRWRIYQPVCRLRRSGRRFRGEAECGWERVGLLHLSGWQRG